MKKNAKEMNELKELRYSLGQALKVIRTDDNRGYTSMRKLAEAVHIPVSNLKYIEDGVNAPSPEVYSQLIENLPVTEEERKELDRMYSAIRGAPPPDVCRIVCTNQALNDALRLIGDAVLTGDQVDEISKLIASYKLPKTEGAAVNG